MVWHIQIIDRERMIASLDPLTALFRASEPNRSLGPGDPRYVNCDAVRGEDVVASMARSLRRADPADAEVKLFAGHRGVGKTSELFRLKPILEESIRDKAPFHVIYMDASESLDVNDLDLPDLLVFITGQVQKQLREASIPRFDAVTTYLSKLWDDFKGMLGTQIALPEVGADAGFASLAIEFRNRPNARRELRKKVELQSSNLLFALNDLLDNANAALETGGYAGLVLIVDGLDKMIRRPLGDGQSNTHDRLFIHRASQLASLRTRTIYTVPISLVYSPQAAQLEQSLGEHNVPVAMICIRDSKDGEIADHTEGMGKLREMMDARCRYANVDPADAFADTETKNYLCRMSGGHPRHLMMFIQSALNEIDDLPITNTAAEHAVRKYANSLLREIPDGFWPLLRKFGCPQDDIPKDDAHQQMLFYLHIFEYMNGRPWYEINPVLRTLPKFNATD